jgi:hypothetical protein
LQLIQLLDWCASHDAGPTRLSLIQIDSYLGSLSGGELLALMPYRKTISPEQFALGRQAWHAVCSPNSSALAALATQEFAALPYLAPALRRFLEEYPSSRDGLSRSEQQFLDAAASGCEMPSKSTSKRANRKKPFSWVIAPHGCALNVWRMDPLRRSNASRRTLIASPIKAGTCWRVKPTGFAIAAASTNG